ncbi:hypothetical protein EXIGLDRAFT_204979 [Exidia glandulosa HHB12029]|uniref:Uncharacterized protein n=1 Tax=Exidia glandulosa HHB12029 TaxID=1314781 RepID=A0A165DW24_EXIGL|nr:hypothetical protein EXIGLDRAFT_775547 [Exidia glandulosa HHB12029]KZV87303.1 hypothetical protein EXIGLDRAFT_204979 [Exidia glandulosa HHB12029]
MDAQSVPPLRISTTASNPVSLATASAALDAFVADYEARTQGESAVSVQLRKVRAALHTEAEANAKKQ